jgi:hypothetical protein
MSKGEFEMVTLTSLYIGGLVLAILWFVTTLAAFYLAMRLRRGQTSPRTTIVTAIIALLFAIFTFLLAISTLLYPTSQTTQQAINRLTPNEPVSGKLGQSSQAYFSIDVPEGSKSLIIQVKGSSEADLEFVVFKGNKRIGRGSINNQVPIQNPDVTTYYIQVVSHSAVESFTLLAEIERSKP